VVLVLLFVYWEPFGGAIWDLQSSLGRGAAYAVFALGWAAVLGATLLINHFDLFGLRQVWLRFRDQPYTGIGFRTPGPYRLVRHPLYVGWLLTFWATPTMTPAHLLFAAGMTVYILIAIRYEERDLAAYHGPEYIAYRARTPMLVPGLPRENSSRQPITTP
jgi:protein-S-isoprenylcysteine O-methyltransferase Ste14